MTFIDTLVETAYYIDIDNQTKTKGIFYLHTLHMQNFSNKQNTKPRLI